jgi:hypothetical protein
MFVRIHTIAQLFLPLGIFDALEDKNFLELTPPQNLTTHGLIADYIVAPNPETIITYLRETLRATP